MKDTDAAPKREIPRGAVTSSNIMTVGFDADTDTLAVEFKSGHIYHHSGVPSELVERFLNADSKGRFYADNVRGKFKSELMTGVCPACHDIGWVGTECGDCGTKKYHEIARGLKES
jgi:hypothetical protein